MRINKRGEWKTARRRVWRLAEHIILRYGQKLERELRNIMRVWLCVSLLCNESCGGLPIPRRQTRTSLGVSDISKPTVFIIGNDFSDCGDGGVWGQRGHDYVNGWMDEALYKQKRQWKGYKLFWKRLKEGGYVTREGTADI